jgi:ribonuclease VapC
VIVDTSALIVILRREPEATAFNKALLLGRPTRISAATLVEARMLAVRYGVLDDLAALLRDAGVIVTPVDEEQADAAAYGFTCYGKGRHPAALNFGDLFAYALAKVTGEPLLFKGSDFARTDVVPAYSQISDVQSPPG